MASSNTSVIAFRIDQETQERVERLAEARQSTPHGVVSEAIHQYLDREEKREALRLDTLNAWTECETTGLHVNADEVSAWLDSWGGEEDELPAPTCHK